ncbi:alpha/beta fold hydrolase [Mucilaginibacter sp.]|uniref:RBBP9/YdeN family alpha/beta hydrolase n=1 Tax=Mucilaginibacter sp. TaxID=1882438 RepID=UPI003267356C
MDFKSTIFILPGLGGSGPEHWQSIWENRFGFVRIEQDDWETPVCEDWIAKIQQTISRQEPGTVILVGHSLACATIAFWAQKYNYAIKGALMVAPSDTEADSYPLGTTGFAPVPLAALPFRSITVFSTNDFYVTAERATLFAESWNSELKNIGDAAHINSASNLGLWKQGLTYLQALDQGA